MTIADRLIRSPRRSGSRRRLGRALAIALALVGCRGERAPGAEVVASLDWVTRSVTGLSGLESDDGAAFTAVSDQGWFVAGRLTRDGTGALEGVEIDRLSPIRGQDGLPVAARRIGDWSDAEGLAADPGGGHWIAFERWTRVARYAGPDAPAEWIRDHPLFRDYANNRELEALALHPDGTLYAFPEVPLGEDFEVFRLGADGWETAAALPRRGRFALTGADFDAGGRLYLLERRYVMGRWWWSRIRRVADPACPEQDEILWRGALDAHGNLEGLAVWQDDGGTRLLAVSDNNGAAGVPTHFVELRVTAPPPAPCARP